MTPTHRREDDVPMTLADVLWDDHTLGAGDLDTCGSVAVESEPGQNGVVTPVTVDDLR